MFSFLSSYIFPSCFMFPLLLLYFLFLLHFVHRSLSIQVNSFWVGTKICAFYFYLVFLILFSTISFFLGSRFKSFAFLLFIWIRFYSCFMRLLLFFLSVVQYFYFIFFLHTLFYLRCLLFLPFVFSSFFFVFRLFFVQLLFFKVFSVSYLSLFLFFCRSYPLQIQYKLVQDNLPKKCLNHAKETTHSLTFLSADNRPFLTDTWLYICTTASYIHFLHSGQLTSQTRLSSFSFVFSDASKHFSLSCVHFNIFSTTSSSPLYILW